MKFADKDFHEENFAIIAVSWNRCSCMNDKESQDLEDVIREESRRGRRPVDIGTVRTKRERLALLKKLWTLATEQEFTEAIRAFGLVEGTPEFSAALDAWREFRP
jgi:hypothetical protein